VSNEVSASNLKVSDSLPLKETPKAFVHRQILIGNKDMIQKSLKRYWKWQRESEKDQFIAEAEKILGS
jgi:hypothetical protein